VDVGRLDVHYGDEEIFLPLIELLPSHQGRGVGSRLIRAVLDRAASEGKPLALNVLDVNRRAYALYRRLGFTEAGRIVEDPAVKIRMVAGT
jgi:ribosomal protein S18 acetylase RimI-like enzyme